MGQCTSGDQDNDDQRYGLKPRVHEFPNYDFYKGEYPIKIHQSIGFHVKYWTGFTQQHQYTKFYQDLESDKQYMQWLYPNFFQSFLNTNSFRMKPDERNKLIADETIMKQYRLNVGMFLRYLGITRNQASELEVCDDRQLEQCLFNYTHNQSRIQRLLSSMSVLGMRKEALEILAVLQQKLTRKHKIYVQKFSQFELIQEENTQNGSEHLKPFQDVKNNYVQEDLLDEAWVTIVILTKKPIDDPDNVAL